MRPRVSQAQAAVNQEETTYQNDQGEAESADSLCSRDNAIVQQDLNDGVEPNNDEQTAEAACSSAQADQEQVSCDSTTLQQDESTLTDAEDALQQAEQG